MDAPGHTLDAIPGTELDRCERVRAIPGRSLVRVHGRGTVPGAGEALFVAGAEGRRLAALPGAPAAAAGGWRLAYAVPDALLDEPRAVLALDVGGALLELPPLEEVTLPGSGTAGSGRQAGALSEQLEAARADSAALRARVEELDAAVRRAQEERDELADERDQLAASADELERAQIEMAREIVELRLAADSAPT